MENNKSTSSRKVPFWEVIKTLLLFCIAFGIILSIAKTIDYLFEKKTEPNNNSTTTREIVTCPPDFLSYQKLITNPKNVVPLISKKTPMYAENGEFHSKIVITKNETDKSKVACGYLFVRAGTETNGSLKSWENLYINPNEFGGHINSENQIGLGDSSSSSEYLFALDKINYWKNRNERAKGNLSTADWGVLLNVSPTIGFEIGLNTNDKTGFIDAFSIAYKCWNPKTGEENHDCSINVVN
jgi:hypothetical protein